jgi:hypothetical protein
LISVVSILVLLHKSQRCTGGLQRGGHLHTTEILTSTGLLLLPQATHRILRRQDTTMVGASQSPHPGYGYPPPYHASSYPSDPQPAWSSPQVYDFGRPPPPHKPAYEARNALPTSKKARQWDGTPEKVKSKVRSPFHLPPSNQGSVHTMPGTLLPLSSPAQPPRERENSLCITIKKTGVAWILRQHYSIRNFPLYGDRVACLPSRNDRLPLASSCTISSSK